MRTNCAHVKPLRPKRAKEVREPERDVQADLLGSIGIRVVTPLALETESNEMILFQLMPVLPVRGQNHVAVTPPTRWSTCT